MGFGVHHWCTIVFEQSSIASKSTLVRFGRERFASSGQPFYDITMIHHVQQGNRQGQVHGVQNTKVWPNNYKSMRANGLHDAGRESWNLWDRTDYETGALILWNKDEPRDEPGRLWVEIYQFQAVPSRITASAKRTRGFVDLWMGNNGCWVATTTKPAGRTPDSDSPAGQQLLKSYFWDINLPLKTLDLETPPPAAYNINTLNWSAPSKQDKDQPTIPAGHCV